jgi:hypothetical protein
VRVSIYGIMNPSLSFKQEPLRSSRTISLRSVCAYLYHSKRICHAAIEITVAFKVTDGFTKKAIRCDLHEAQGRIVSKIGFRVLGQIYFTSVSD